MGWDNAFWVQGIQRQLAYWIMGTSNRYVLSLQYPSIEHLQSLPVDAIAKCSGHIVEGRKDVITKSLDNSGHFRDDPTVKKKLYHGGSRDLHHLYSNRRKA